MKLTPILAAGLAATLMASGFTYAQTAPAPASVVILDDAIAQMPEVQAIIDEMVAQGYTNIEVSSTMLGRAKIKADGPDGTRVVVLSTSTGEIMRDMVHGADHGNHDDNMGGNHDDDMTGGSHDDDMVGGSGGGHGGGMGGGSNAGHGGGMGGGMSGN